MLPFLIWILIVLRAIIYQILRDSGCTYFFISNATTRMIIIIIITTGTGTTTVSSIVVTPIKQYYDSNEFSVNVITHSESIPFHDYFVDKVYYY